MSKTWPMVRLGEVLGQVERAESVDATCEYRLLGVRWYGEGLFERENKLGNEIKATKVYRVQKGDFVDNRLFAWKGSFAVAGPESNDCHVSHEFPCFEPHQARVDTSFLRWWFRRESAWAQALGLSSGATPTSRNRLKEAQFLLLEIPLPPLAEQRRLVARIEELAAQIHEARTLRQQADDEAKALSYSGIEATYRQLRESVGVCRLADVCETITDGDHNTPIFSDSGIRFIFVGNVSSAYLHFDNSKRVSDDYFKTLKPQRLPIRGDILYSAVGATLGIPPVVDSDEPFCFQRHVAIIKPDRLRIDSQFAWHMLRSRTIFEKAWASTTGTAQPTIPLGAIRELPIPVPPLAEQLGIVAELDALQAAVDALKRLQVETAAELDALLLAILDRAFKGEL